MTGYETVVAALEQRGLIVPSWGQGVRALCPSHDDTKPSLSINEAEGKALVYCFAGCDTKDVVEALGLSLSDLFNGDDPKGPTAQLYTYVDEDGKPLSRVHRTAPKGFWQERYEDGEWKPGLRDVRRVLYRLPTLLDAEEVWITEGEKDAETLVGLGITATTALGGASAWRDDYADSLRAAKRIVIVGDNDPAGRQRVARCRLALRGLPAAVRACYPRADCKDVTAHLEAGFTLDELVEDVADLEVFEPFDWQSYEVPPQEWLLEPLVPRAGRVLAFGAAGSLKSLWAMWLAARLTNEGHRVAYFSLEMNKTDLARRMKQVNADPKLMEVYSSLSFSNELQATTILEAMRGYSLIVIDSWSAALTGAEWNEEVARIDREFFLPIVETTGATLLILDNTGHPVITDAGKFKADHARGASAKGDKMEVTLWFDRPYDDDNYCTRITVKKMRLDRQMPLPVIVQTPQDRIEFYYFDEKTRLRGLPMWPGKDVLQTPSGVAVNADTAYERRVKARVADRLKKVDV